METGVPPRFRVVDNGCQCLGLRRVKKCPFSSVMTKKLRIRLPEQSTMLRITFSVLILVQTYIGHCTSTEIDENGYIAYCPCMGRFGNQADNFLGALGFSIALNRTLVIPPWVEYRTGATRSTQVPFNTYFNISQLESCHRVIVMDEFMKSVAPIVWPESRRISFCYSVRGNTGSCNAKEGNPFGPFWDTFDVEFTGSEFYGPLHYDVHHSDMVDQWTNRYPPSSWPVLAFTGAPASFPVQMENKKLQKCIRWNDEVSNKAKSYVKKHLPRGAYVGIHLRNGIDWTRACEFISSSPNLFAAPQCLGYRNERGKATVAMCLPPLELIIRHLKRVIRTNNDVKSIYVASDNNHMIPELSKALRRMEISVYKQEEPASPHLDLAILGNSNYFIGNCISSFSAFVAREREVRGLPTYFWGFPPERTMSSVSHEEL